MSKTVAPNFSPDFSVVICTYNGALKLPALLERLSASEGIASEALTQIDAKRNTKRDDASTPSFDGGFSWEVVVVDNNSSDATAEVVHEAQKTWPASIPLRYCFEPSQGLAFARRRAIKETKSPLIGFLDDDTLPAPSWVSAAFTFGQQHPNVGAYGSSIQGLYEVSPPPNFHRIACCLAIIDRGSEPFQYSARAGVLPAGAGMVIRRQAWLDQVPERPALAGVKAGSLSAKGEDVETLSYIRQAWPIWHNPAMKLFHLIPRDRLERDYLLHLFWQIGLSRYPLRKLRYASWQWPLMVLLYFVSDMRKSLSYLLRWYWCHVIKGHFVVAFNTTLDTVEACEIALLFSSLLSPFYAPLRQRRSRWKRREISTDPRVC
ncbi:MAG: hormogonium polysaccharide biosynthesis glycosyltransferase HpsE [Cyanobacteria bacterium J06555_13]